MPALQRAVLPVRRWSRPSGEGSRVRGCGGRRPCWQQQHRRGKRTLHATEPLLGEMLPMPAGSVMGPPALADAPKEPLSKGIDMTPKPAPTPDGEAADSDGDSDDEDNGSAEKSSSSAKQPSAKSVRQRSFVFLPT